MNHPDESKNEFSWTLLFIVTAICCCGFSCAMKFLNGSFSPVFNKIAIACSVLGGLGIIKNLLSGIKIADNTEVSAEN